MPTFLEKLAMLVEGLSQLAVEADNAGCAMAYEVLSDTANEVENLHMELDSLETLLLGGVPEDLCEEEADAKAQA
jgi:hypothetical protein